MCNVEVLDSAEADEGEVESGGESVPFVLIAPVCDLPLSLVTDPSALVELTSLFVCSTDILPPSFACFCWVGGGRLSGSATMRLLLICGHFSRQFQASLKK